MAISKVTSGGIAADVIDGTKIADNAVDTEHLADDAVDSAEIAAGAVDDAHLATGITASKLTGTLPAISGVNLTALNATNLGSGTVPTARLGSGTASSGTILYGDQTYKAAPTSFDPDAAQVFNESGADVDFRVESDTNANAFFINGATGNVGIGVDPANAKLELSHALSAGTMGSYTVRLVNTQGAGNFTSIQLSGANQNTYLGYHDHGTASSQRFSIGVGADAEHFSVQAGGDVTLQTGDLVFASAGKGVCLGVTSNTDANTLDDYEEGTWTPGFATGTPTYTTTYNRTGSYTKIGNVCHVTMEMYMGSISFSDATATMTFSGLPFAAGGTGHTFGIAIASHVQLSNIYTHGVTYNNLGSGNDDLLNFQPGIASGATQFVMDVSPFNNSVRGHLKNAAFHNGSGLVVGLTYRTA